MLSAKAMQCKCSPCGIQMQLYKGAPSFAQQSPRFCSDIIQPQQPPCWVSMCAALLGVGVPHPFAAFSVVAEIQPWEIAQDTLNEPSFPGKKKSTWKSWRAAGCWRQQKLSNKNRRWTERSRQHTFLSPPQLPAAQRGFVPGSPLALQCSFCWRGDVQGFWPRAPVVQTATPSAQLTMHKAGSPVRDLPTVQGWGWCSASLSARHSQHSHLGLRAHLAGVVHCPHHVFPMPIK